MRSDSTTVVDFVARGERPNQWNLILVEQGPWSGPVDDQLRRVQERLYGCVDAALDGQVAEAFPESMGKEILVKLECFNLPRGDVEGFFQRFAAGIFHLEAYRSALERCEFVAGISFAIDFDNAQ